MFAYNIQCCSLEIIANVMPDKIFNFAHIVHRRKKKETLAQVQVCNLQPWSTNVKPVAIYVHARGREQTQT